MKLKLRSALFLSSLVIGLSACEPTVAERGNMVDPTKLAQIKVGFSKEDVVNVLGSPTTIGTFDENYWFYMGQRTEQEAFFDPEVTDRRVVEIDFDDDDKVSSVKELGLNNGENVAMDEDMTPVQGHQTTLAEEMFGRGGFGSDQNSKKKKDSQ